MSKSATQYLTYVPNISQVKFGLISVLVGWCMNSLTSGEKYDEGCNNKSDVKWQAEPNFWLS